MSITDAEFGQVVVVWRHGGRCGDGNRRPVGGLAGGVWDGFGWVAAGKVKDYRLVVVEVRCGHPLYVFIKQSSEVVGDVRESTISSTAYLTGSVVLGGG